MKISRIARNAAALAALALVSSGCSYSGLSGYEVKPRSFSQATVPLDGLTAGEGPRRSEASERPRRTVRDNTARENTESTATTRDTSTARERWMRSETPVVGSAEWKRDEADDANKESQMNRRMNGICRGC